MTSFFRALILVEMAAASALAGEYAVLSTGFRIHADHHERDAGFVRLFDNDGVTELPAGSVVAFEPEEFVAPPPAPPMVEAPLPALDSRTLVHDAAVRTGLPPAFVESVARVESAMRPQAVSPKGAVGVMQLMPSTARALSADPRDPAQNIDAGARLLRDLLIKYDGDVVKALSAYNAGAGAVDRYRGMPPYAETQNYVDKVIRTYLQAGGR
ncbi:MAG TPA: lytic transglycosylase domain-containing protein [Bryobacteraceae bacterium]|nr:lytic transglycosylase domain-containing protein [Bryobacteraceae bacterium]